jgi:AcrR family transcriptional regulator
MASFRAIARFGPARLTLGDVAREAGVSAAALVQRFGSKRALLLAAAADAAGGADYIFPGLREHHRSPYAALLGLADCMTLLGTTPDTVANTLAFQNGDVQDAEFHRHALAGSEGMRDGIRGLVREAIRIGELRRVPAGRLASAIHAILQGSIQAWVVHRQGTLPDWIRRDLTTLLAPYRLRRGRAPV